MYKRPLQTLLFVHYILFAAVLIVYFILNNIFKSNYLTLYLCDRDSTEGIMLQTGVILLALSCITGGLYWFKRHCETLREIDDQSVKFSRYVVSAIIREVVVFFIPALASMVTFFGLAGYKPMLWLLGITAVAWFFCKPTERQIHIDTSISPYDDSY